MEIKYYVFMVGILISLLIGYAVGRRVGKKEGFKEGMSYAPLKLVWKGNDAASFTASDYEKEDMDVTFYRFLN